MIEDKALNPVYVGLLGVVGIVLEPYFIPSASSGQARTWSSSRRFGRCVMTMSPGLEAYLDKERSYGTIPLSNSS